MSGRVREPLQTRKSLRTLYVCRMFAAADGDDRQHILRTLERRREALMVLTMLFLLGYPLDFNRQVRQIVDM